MGVAERGAKDKTAWLVMSVEDISLGQYLPLRNVLSKKKKTNPSLRKHCWPALGPRLIRPCKPPVQPPGDPELPPTTLGPKPTPHVTEQGDRCRGSRCWYFGQGLHTECYQACQFLWLLPSQGLTFQGKLAEWGASKGYRLRPSGCPKQQGFEGQYPSPGEVASKLGVRQVYLSF